MKQKLKSILSLAWVLLATHVFSQTFTTHIDKRQAQGQGFAYDITVRLTLIKQGTQAYLDQNTKYTVELVSVRVDKNKGWYMAGKTYSCAQLNGICDTKTFSNVHLQLSYRCEAKVLESNSMTFYNAGDKATIDLLAKSTGGSTACYGPIASGIGYATVNDSQLANTIYYMTQNQENGQNKTAQNPLSNTSASEKINTNPQLQADEYFQKNVINNTPLGTYNPPASDDKFTRNMQNATTIVNTLGAYMEQQRQERAQQEAAMRAQADQYKRVQDEEFIFRRREAEEYFQLEFLDKYLAKANQGDEQSRLLLYRAKKELTNNLWGKQNIKSSSNATIDFETLLNWKVTMQWLKEAAYNKNMYAALELANRYSNLNYGATEEVKRENRIGEIEFRSIAAELGNVEAMYKVCDLYSYNSFTNVGLLSAEDQSQKILYFAEMAAKNGCPRAMIHLGRGYMNSYYGLNKNKTQEDYKKGLDWLLKAMSSETPRMKGVCEISTYYLEDACKMIAIAYQKGLGVEKNPELAKEYKAKAVYYKKDGVDTRPMRETVAQPTDSSALTTPIPKIYLNESFSQNYRKWYENEENNFSSKLLNGKYRITKRGGDAYCTLPFKFDTENDFEVSATMTKVAGTDGYYFGVMLGFNTTTKYYHYMGLTGWGDYVLANKGPSPNDIVRSAPNSIVLTGNANNTIKLRKQNGMFELYVNDRLMGKAPAEAFYGGFFGFKIWSGNDTLTIDFDNFVLKTLK